ncbi:retrotransposon gag protein [Cucumis melo var. makuwa]|uniref:Retrotransposon gag protein n=1 Tax=Cucumis melo var. makuwa TaxID=1194695 RepID=A0A5A7UXA1_CUCMM|nr:retrotransposon gag protein [Cucumis melo var. makuwa]TYJ99783.1 retrotransposon gag protein [Cucumis melo var. makuwa]
MRHPNIMSVMVTNVDTSENRMAELEKKVNMLMKVVEERDYEIAFLKNHFESRDAAESSHKHTVKNIDKEKAEMIANSIKTQYGGSAQTFSLYSKPYTKRIDNLRMPNGYQPPKFQQFDGKGNPKQHVAHFIETCETAGTRGDLLVKQFVRTLKGNAFEWYIDLEPESIDNWEQLERDFLNRFCSTRRIDRLTELSAVEMCTRGMHWGLLYILQGIKPRTFEELATRAHDMELSIANRGAKDFLIPKSMSDKNELDDTKKIENSVIKESMVVHATPLKSFSKRKETKIERQHGGDEKRQSTLKERQEKVYPFPDSDVADMLEQLLENQLIQLPECKRPEQAGKLILKLAREKKIELDIDEVAQTNHVAIEMTSNVLPLTQLYDQRKSLIQFGTSAPILVLFQQRIVTINSQNKEAHGKDDGEGWITVTRQKGRQPNSIQKESRFHQKYAKGSISHKKKGRRKKKMWNPKPIKGKHEDFLQLRRSITLADSSQEVSLRIIQKKYLKSLHVMLPA